MRKICTLVLTLFYLSLSTGGYACLIHCTTSYLAVQLQKSSEAHIGVNDQAHGEKDGDDDCRTGDCSCCYHHGIYVVKENAKIATHFSFLNTDIGVPILHDESIMYVLFNVTKKVRWLKSTGPPFLFAKPIYLSNKSFLIWSKLMPDSPARIPIISFLAWITMTVYYISTMAIFLSGKWPDTLKFLIPAGGTNKSTTGSKCKSHPDYKGSGPLSNLKQNQEVWTSI